MGASGGKADERTSPEANVEDQQKSPTSGEAMIHDDEDEGADTPPGASKPKPRRPGRRKKKKEAVMTKLHEERENDDEAEENEIVSESAHTEVSTHASASLEQGSGTQAEDQVDEGSSKTEPDAAIEEARATVRVRDRLLEYLESVIARLAAPETRPASNELRERVIPSVVAGIRSFAQKSPPSIRDSLKNELVDSKVLPDYAADLATFQASLVRCAEIVSGRPPAAPLPALGRREMTSQLVLKNTFVEVCPDSDGEDIASGRCMSDPTGSGVAIPAVSLSPSAFAIIGKSDRRATALSGVPEDPTTGDLKLAASLPDIEEEPKENVVEDLARVESHISDSSSDFIRAVSYGGATASSPPAFATPAISASERNQILQRMEHIAAVGHSAQVGGIKYPSIHGSATADSVGTNIWGYHPTGGWHDPVASNALDRLPETTHKLITNKTFLEVKEERDDDSEGEELSVANRACSDPTGGGQQRHKWVGAVEAAKRAAEACVGPRAGVESEASPALPAIIGDIQFADQEGDVIRLRMPTPEATLAAGGVGCLILEINGESHGNVQEFELECSHAGQYGLYMNGMGAIMAQPPPGDQQHTLVSNLLRLAIMLGVTVRAREQNGACQGAAAVPFTPGAAMWPGGMDMQQQMLYSSWYACPPMVMGPATPSFSNTHCFHSEVSSMGIVNDSFREFTKQGYEGRLSVITESHVHTGGVHRFLVKFEGDMSKADGVGFIFAKRLPCKKNIQRIVSIFVNQRGRICMRIFSDVTKASASVKPLKSGDWIEMSMDLDNHVVCFTTYPASIGVASSFAEFAFGRKIAGRFQNSLTDDNAAQLDLSTGHLACVVKNVGVTVKLGS